MTFCTPGEKPANNCRVPVVNPSSDNAEIIAANEIGQEG